MASSELGSRSDLEALRRSGRGKVLALGALVLAALAAAVWSFTRPEGLGNPEDPTKVLVVTDGSRSGYSLTLGELGFDAAEGTLTAWEKKAHEEIDELDASGIDAVLQLADTFGYAYVAFESPQNLDFSSLELDAEADPEAEHVRFAVLSVGDFAFPHYVSVNPPPSQVMRDPTLVLLQALFAQPRLARLLPDSEEDEQIEDIQLRDTLSGAVDRVARIPEAERMVERIVHDISTSLDEKERAEPKPRGLLESLESGSAIPLPSGAVLTVGRGFQLVTRDAVRVDLDLDEQERFTFGMPQVGSAQRQPCTDLAGGSLSVHDSPRYAFSADGAVVLIKTLSSGGILWRAKSKPKGGCAFERLGVAAPAQPGLEGTAVPHGSGKVARTGVLGSQAVVSVFDVGTGNEELLGMLEDVELGSVVWLTDEILAVVGNSLADDRVGIYLLSLEVPMVVLRLDSTVFEGATDVEQVAAVPGGAAMVATAGAMPRKLYHLRAPRELPGLFTQAELAPDDTGNPQVIELDPNAFIATALTEQGRVHDPVVSPTGELVAFTIRDPSLDEADAADDDEIGVVPTVGGAMRLLTRNALKDYDPRFTADGEHVVFRTRVEIPRTEWVITAPRIVASGRR